MFQLLFGQNEVVKATPAVDVSRLHRCQNVDPYCFIGQIKYRFCAPITITNSSLGCQTLIYAPTGEFYDSVMKILAEQNDLVFGDDVIGYCGLCFIL